MAPPSRRKCTNRIIPRPPLAHGFRSEEEFQWYNDFFKTREVMIERALDVTCPPGDPVPFFIARLRSYPNWEQTLTQPKVVNVGWVREVCATLIKDDTAPYTYFACLRGQELEISPATVEIGRAHV